MEHVNLNLDSNSGDDVGFDLSLNYFINLRGSLGRGEYNISHFECRDQLDFEAERDVNSLTNELKALSQFDLCQSVFWQVAYHELYQRD